MSKYVTDEMVEEALEASYDPPKEPGHTFLNRDYYRILWSPHMRAALEAVAPLIAAQALRDAAEELSQQGVEPWDRNSVAIRTLNFLADKIEKDAPTRSNRITEADSWNTL